MAQGTVEWFNAERDSGSSLPDSGSQLDRGASLIPLPDRDPLGAAPPRESHHEIGTVGELRCGQTHMPAGPI